MNKGLFNNECFVGYKEKIDIKISHFTQKKFKSHIKKKKKERQ